MSFDTELILQTLSRRFEAFEAKWESRFPSGGAAHHGHEGTSKLPSPSPATTTPPAVAVAVASPDAPPEGADAGLEVLLVACSTSTATGSSEVDDNTRPLFTSRTQPGATEKREVPVPPLATTCSAATSDTKHMPLATFPPTTTTSPPTCAPEPAAQGAEEEVTANLPTKCSTECLSHDIDVLKSMDTITGIWNAPLIMFSFTGDIPLDINRDSSLKHLQGRYIITITHSLSSGIIVLPCVGIDDNEYHKVLELESMKSQSIIVFGQLTAHVFDKQQWPPPLLDCNTMYFSPGISFRCGQEGEKERPPWPPPTQWDMHIASAQLRPIPWPSFGSHSVALQLGNFLMFYGLHQYFKLMASQHTLQDILVIYALGFQSWSTSFTLEIHSDVSDRLLHSSLFISWTDMYWLLLYCHHKPVKRKFMPLLLHWYEVFEELSGQITKILLPSLAILVDIVPWPLPVQYEVTNDKVQLRPVPWSSFWEYYVHVRWLNILTIVVVDSATEVQLSQHAILADCGCYQLQGKGIRAGLFIWSPWKFQCSVAFFVDFITGCNLLPLIVGKRVFLLSQRYPNEVKWFIFSGKSKMPWEDQNLDPMFFAKLSVTCSQQLTSEHILENSDKKEVPQYLTSLVKPQQKLGDGLLASITEERQVILWDLVQQSHQLFSSAAVHVSNMIISYPIRSLLLAWSANDQLEVVVIKSEEDAYGNSEFFRGVRNINFKLQFYNLITDDP